MDNASSPPMHATIAYLLVLVGGYNWLSIALEMWSIGDCLPRGDTCTLQVIDNLESDALCPIFQSYTMPDLFGTIGLPANVSRVVYFLVGLAAVALTLLAFGGFRISTGTVCGRPSSYLYALVLVGALNWGFYGANSLLNWQGSTLRYGESYTCGYVSATGVYETLPSGSSPTDPAFPGYQAVSYTLQLKSSAEAELFKEPSSWVFRPQPPQAKLEGQIQGILEPGPGGGAWNIWKEGASLPGVWLDVSILGRLIWLGFGPLSLSMVDWPTPYGECDSNINCLNSRPPVPLGVVYVLVGMAGVFLAYSSVRLQAYPAQTRKPLVSIAACSSC